MPKKMYTNFDGLFWFPVRDLSNVGYNHDAMNLRVYKKLNV